VAVGNVAVVLSASPSGLQAGLSKATSDLQQFASKAKSMLAGIAFGGLQGGLAMLGPGGALASALTSMVTSTLDRVRMQSIMAQATGMSTSQFQALTAGAGPMQEAMGRGLEHMARSLGQMRQGKTAAEDKFGVLGIDTDQLKNLSTDEAFTAIADRISKMGTETDKAAAFEIFGRRGQEILPILRKGAAGVEELKEKAREMGLVLSEQDNEKISKLARAEQRVKQAKQSIDNFVTLQAASVLEAGDDALNAVKNMARGTGGSPLTGLAAAFGKGFAAGGQGSDAEANLKFTQMKRKLDDELIALEQNQVLRLQRQMDKDNLNDNQQNEVREKFLQPGSPQAP
jgi:hypothetical protein